MELPEELFEVTNIRYFTTERIVAAGGTPQAAGMIRRIFSRLCKRGPDHDLVARLGDDAMLVMSAFTATPADLAFIGKNKIKRMPLMGKATLSAMESVFRQIGVALPD